MSDWDPALYLRFDAERTRPALDLAARVPLESPARIADLGCGAGNSTSVLARRWPAARITGVDSSERMLAQARAQGPHAEWVQADISVWQPEDRFDLVFSNAALQWVHGHDVLLPRLLDLLKPGGCLAIQIPWHLHSTIHRLIERTVRDGPWAPRLPAAEEIFEIRAPREYYDILSPLCREVEMWLTEYHHSLENPAAVLDWMRGTGLRPYLECLDGAEQAAFLDALQTHIASAFQPRADGRVLFPFPRLFVVARL